MNLKEYLTTLSKENLIFLIEAISSAVKAGDL